MGSEQSEYQPVSTLFFTSEPVNARLAIERAQHSLLTRPQVIFSGL